MSIRLRVVLIPVAVGFVCLATLLACGWEPITGPELVGSWHLEEFRGEPLPALLLAEAPNSPGLPCPGTSDPVELYIDSANIRFGSGGGFGLEVARRYRCPATAEDAPRSETHSGTWLLDRGHLGLWATEGAQAVGSPEAGTITFESLFYLGSGTAVFVK